MFNLNQLKTQLVQFGASRNGPNGALFQLEPVGNPTGSNGFFFDWAVSKDSNKKDPIFTENGALRSQEGQKNEI